MKWNKIKEIILTPFGRYQQYGISGPSYAESMNMKNTPYDYGFVYLSLSGYKGLLKHWAYHLLHPVFTYRIVKIHIERVKSGRDMHIHPCIK